LLFSVHCLYNRYIPPLYRLQNHLNLPQLNVINFEIKYDETTMYNKLIIYYLNRIKHYKKTRHLNGIFVHFNLPIILFTCTNIQQPTVECNKRKPKTNFYTKHNVLYLIPTY